MGRSLKASRTLVWNAPIRLRAFAERENRPLPFRVSEFFIAIPQQSHVSADSVSGWCELTLSHGVRAGSVHGTGSRDDYWDEHAFWRQGIDAWGV